MTLAANQPLQGLRILDLTTTIFGPYTTQILADFGAEVIKVEAPGGDPTRHVGPNRSPGMSALFLACNRNKKSLEIDLKDKAAAEAFWRVIETADMLVHNMRPQKIEALGFGPDAVRARCPKLVYGGLHGYRMQGPYGAKPAYDDVIQGQSGLAGMFAARDGTPALVPAVIADKTAALIAANGLLAALTYAMRSGQGSYVECGMFEGIVSYNLVEHFYGAQFDQQGSEVEQEKPGYPRMLTPFRKPHQTLDGHICMLAYTDRQWRDFWSVTGQTQHANDPRFSTMAARAEHIGLLYETAGEILKTKKSAEWLALLQRAEIPAGPVNRLDQLQDDPHLKEIGFFRAYDHPSEGAMTIPDTPYQINGSSLPIHTPHPKLGEQTVEILHTAGCTGEQITTITAQNTKGKSS